MVPRIRAPFIIVKRTCRMFQSTQWRTSKILLDSTITGWLNQLVLLLALSKKMVRTYALLVTLQLTESRLTPYLTLEVRLTLSVWLCKGIECTILRLEKPATLQLGCSGSRLKINFATIAVVEFGLTTAKNYLDIANLDKYDCILGTPFLRKHGISLDFQFQDIVIRGKLHIPALPEEEGMSTMKPIRRGKWLHGQEQWAEESLTRVEPSKSWRNPVTIEEVEEDDIHKMNAMNKLDTDSINIMESDDDDEQILFKHQNKKETWQHQNIPQEKPKDKLPEVPSYYTKWFELKNAPKMTECGVPTLHSNNYQYKGPSPKEEVLLAAMDANINELKKGDEDLPELCKKWVEAAANILTSAPSLTGGKP